MEWTDRIGIGVVIGHQFVCKPFSNINLGYLQYFLADVLRHKSFFDNGLQVNDRL